jgi:hypothetical protein
LCKDDRIERLEKLVAAFRQAASGHKSEKRDPEQFELALEDLETSIAGAHAEDEADTPATKRHTRPRVANRGSLPKYLPRIEEVIEPESLVCICGGLLALYRRRYFRAAGHDPGTVPRHRYPPPEIRLPRLH